MDPTDEALLRRAIALASAARAAGEEPYGSLLAGPGGAVLAEDHNTTRSDADITAHPELKLARWAARELDPADARATTMYTSCHPCPMCAGAIERSGLGRVVFALSAEQAEAVDPAAHPREPVAYDGPALYAEARVPLAAARLEGEHVALRPAAPTDGPALAVVLADPEVARWWGPEAPEEMLADPEVHVFVVLVGEAVAGFVQFAEVTDPMYRSANLDVALASPWHGRGHGTDAVRTLARHLISARGHDRLTIDPAAANERAIAAYRRVGFKPVGVMRAYERGPDGTKHDGLLMDLLAGELT